MRRLLIASIGLLALLGGHGRTQGDLIQIVNAGFEDPAVSSFTSSGAAGWTRTGDGGGVWNINDAPLGFWTVSTPEGNQIGWLSTAPSGGPASYAQTLSATLQANTVYTLAGQVGHPIGFGVTTGTVYTADLLAGGNLLATASGTAPEGSFAPFELTFTSVGSPFLGQSLSIRLSSSGAQTGFDAIRLNANVVPEPASLLILGTGGLGLLGLGRMRRGRRRFSGVNSR